MRENVEICSALWVASSHLCFVSRQQRRGAAAPQEGGGDNEEFDYLSCTLFSTIIHPRNLILHTVLLI